MKVDFQIVKCACGEIHVPARAGEPCARCRVEARPKPEEKREQVPNPFEDIVAEQKAMRASSSS